MKGWKKGKKRYDGRRKEGEGREQEQDRRKTTVLERTKAGCNYESVSLLQTILILLSALILFYCVVNRKMIQRCCRSMCNSEDIEEEQAEEAQERRRSRRTRWYSEPPPYLEVAEEDPPPTYLEAVAKECLGSGGGTREEATERAAAPQPVPPKTEGEWGVDALSTLPPSSSPHPDAAPAPALHM